MLTQSVPAHIEAVLLELFWWYVNEHKGERLELLKILAAQPVIRSADWSTAHVREQAERTTAKMATDDGCFSCGTRERHLYAHHVIQVQHGGSNHPKNRIAICYRCHAAIHPWLPADRKGEQRGGEWWSLADVVQNAQRRETPLGDVAEDVQREASEEVER